MPFICSAELPNDHAPALSPRTPVLDVSRPLTSAEHEALDELLAQYGRRNPEEEEEEEAAVPEHWSVPFPPAMLFS